MDFEGKVAIVTGGSRGIGRAYVNVLLQLGMKVCIADVNEEVAREFIGQLSEPHKSKVMFKKCDVTSFKELKDVFEKTISTFGRLDMVINNAGYFNEGEWERMIQVNIVGVVHGIKLAFEYMDKNKTGHGGHVISTASEAGFESRFVCPVYAGTKHAVVGITKGYGDDFHFQKTGIKVCAICPGPVDTEFYAAFGRLTLYPEETQKLIPTMRPVQPEVIGAALLKLLEDGRNGSLLRIDADGPRYVEY